MGGNNLSVPLDHAKKTGVLSLQNKKLEKFPEEIFGLRRNLRTLDVSTNRLEELPDDIGVLQMLRTFKLDDNKIGQLPNTIGNLGKLEALHLAGNPLMDWPTSVHRCGNLKHLDLSRCRISVIPDSIRELKKLDYICLSNNRLHDIPEGMCDLKVVEIDLNNNGIAVIPAGLSRNQSLRVLRLDYNSVTCAGISTEILGSSLISTLSLEGNPLDLRKFREMDGYDKYEGRYAATKRKCD